MRIFFAILVGLSSLSAVAAPPTSAAPTTEVKTSQANDMPRDVPSFEAMLKMRDPFKKPDLSKYRKSMAAKTELERFAVSDYKLMGVITGPKEVRAMVVAPDKKTHFVKKGQKIGIQNGVITSIDENTIHVREQVTNLLGTTEYVVTEIRLPAGQAIDVIDVPASSQEPADTQNPSPGSMMPLPQIPHKQPMANEDDEESDLADEKPAGKTGEINTAPEAPENSSETTEKNPGDFSPQTGVTKHMRYFNPLKPNNGSTQPSQNQPESSDDNNKE